MTLETQSGLAALAQLVTSKGDSPGSLPPSLYVSPSFFELEKRRIFLQDWYCFGHATDFARPGDFLATELLGEPLLIWAGTQGQIRAFSNICRHRNTILAPAGRGKARLLTCPYHAWTYNSEGTLRGMPDKPEHLNTSTIRLKEFRVELWQGFVFVSLNDNVEPLAARLQGLDALIGNARMDQFSWGIRCVDSSRKANWKILIEGAMDSYHAPHVHKTAFTGLLPNLERPSRAANIAAGEDWFVSVSSRRRTPWPRFDNDPAGLRDEIRSNVYSIAILPSLILSLDCHNVFWWTTHPENPGHTRHAVGVAARTPERLNVFGQPEPVTPEWLQQWLAQRHMEDTGVQEAVQRGAASAFAVSGPLVEKLEGRLVEFHRWLHGRLAA
jgi:phenylpropionate dioxygenase-like ring-hydroxylating dioxygenase large terminal subunit